MTKHERELEDLVGIDQYGQPIIREVCPICQEKHVIPGDCAGLRILPADDPTPSKQDWFSMLYLALAYIGMMTIFVWGAKLISMALRWMR